MADDELGRRRDLRSGSEWVAALEPVLPEGVDVTPEAVAAYVADATWRLNALRDHLDQWRTEQEERILGRLDFDPDEDDGAQPSQQHAEGAPTELESDPAVAPDSRRAGAQRRRWRWRRSGG